MVLRRGPDTVGMLLRMTVTIDGAVAARLRPGREKVLTLAPGTYTVAACLEGSRSHPLELRVDGESVVVEIATPWRLNIFSTEPGTVSIRMLPAEDKLLGAHGLLSGVVPEIFDPRAHPPRRRRWALLAADRRLGAFLRRRPRAWGIALLAAGVLSTGFGLGSPRLHQGWSGHLLQVPVGVLNGLLIGAGIVVLATSRARRDTEHKNP